MKKPFSGLHARAICHATEDIERVGMAVRNLLGDVELSVTKTEGVHGNPIRVVEGSLEQMDEIESFLERLGKDDLERIIRTLSSRIDDGCNMFLRLRKQAALANCAELGEEGDVVSIRIRIAAFPAKPEVAARVAREYLEGVAQR